MTYRDYISIEKHALTLFTSAFLSPYDELFNIKQNFKMKKYMPLNGLRWSRDSGSALCGTPPTDVLGQAGGGTIAPAITSHYFKAGVRDFLFALAIPHCCLIIEYE